MSNNINLTFEIQNYDKRKALQMKRFPEQHFFNSNNS